MLRAVVFDDEYIVLKGFKQMINWKKYMIDIVATAEDGHTALSIVREVLPDIVFTDIRMPGIDGLQLIESILAIAPETICIVFSGFQDYEYLRKAIKLGVTDYIEKPITIPKIEESMQKIIEKKNHQNHITSLRLKWKDSERDLLEKATLDLLLQHTKANEKWCNLFGDDADRIKAITVLACSKFHNTMLYENLPFYRIISIRNGEQYLYVVFHLDEEIDILQEQLVELSDITEGVIGIGRTYENINELSESYREAIKALKHALFIEEKGLFFFTDLGEAPTQPRDLSDREENVINFMRKGNLDAVLTELSRYIQWLRKEKIDPDVTEREILKLIYFAMEVVRDTAGEKSLLWEKKYVPHVMISEQRNWTDLEQWLQTQFKMMMEITIERRQENKHSSIPKALTYIESYYNQNITLKDVSDHIGMNFTYFSLLFKEEMKMSYIKYLTKYRMEKAKSLLKGGENVTEVCKKVGYYTTRHFSQVFKKYYGMTPGDYKKIHQRD
ncbi:response regulator [Bacillus solitudinis]|uniref:response regulator n=1 Tax=Bacillus solitudinis TaxID=2014074 RepID=UPI000C23F6F7|nr:response regulator [Bacillus solitudinis]